MTNKIAHQPHRYIYGTAVIALLAAAFLFAFAFSLPISHAQTKSGLKVNASATPITFKPPYLRYSVPSEYAQIVAIRNAHMATTSSSQDLDTSIALSVPDTPNQGHGGTAAVNVPLKKIASPDKISGTGIQTPVKTGAAAPDTPSQAKTAGTFPVQVNPSGVVTAGFYCPTDFEASVDKSAYSVEWSVKFDGDPEARFLGVSRGQKARFTVDGLTYNMAAQNTPIGSYPGGSTTFRVTAVTRTVLGISTGTGTSSPTTLNFGTEPCVQILNVDLSKTSLKGDDHGQEPTLTVYLTNPAPPGGQKINLQIIDGNNPTVGRFLGNDYFYIPAGATSGSYSWFLGTRKVLADRTFVLKITANGSGGPRTITVTRK